MNGQEETLVLQTLPGTNHCQWERDCLVSLATPSGWDHADLPGDPVSLSSPRLPRSPAPPRPARPGPECGTSPTAGQRVGTKPWRGPGGLKSPRHNEGVESAQGRRGDTAIAPLPTPHPTVLAEGLAWPGREGSDALLPLGVTKFGSARVAL